MYRALTQISGPLINYYLKRRLNTGKEDGQRFAERMGHPSCPRPDGPLVWIHAATLASHFP